MVTEPTTTMGLRNACITRRYLVEGSERHRAQTGKEKDEHEKQECFSHSRSTCKLVPYKDAPAGRNHGGALADGIAHRGPNKVCARCDKIRNAADAPDRAP